MGTMTAIILGAFDYTGGVLTGYKRDPEMDEFERKQELRKNRRRPIEQTISELGEGRGIYQLPVDNEDGWLTIGVGIYGPGYDERRRERIKEKYGIDVQAKS
jgi:hypothetical protein